jgi:RNA polymerase sigma-70 factor (ECF subfamily)
LLRAAAAGILLRAGREGVVLRRGRSGNVRLPGGQPSNCLKGCGMATASEQVWRELHARLRAFVARRVGEADADDLVQEVLFRIHRRIDTLDQADRLDAWAYQITRNAIVDHHRARARRSEALVEDAGDLAASTERAMLSADEPEAVEAGRELAACLTPLVERLAEPYRQAVGLVELEGLPQAEAAAHLGLSTSGMKSRVQRARRQLKALLLDCCHVELDRRGGIMDYRARGGRCGACSAAGGQPCCDG